MNLVDNYNFKFDVEIKSWVLEIYWGIISLWEVDTTIYIDGRLLSWKNREWEEKKFKNGILENLIFKVRVKVKEFMKEIE